MMFLQKTNKMNNSNNNEKILILDFGSQVTQLIARRVRESGVYSEIFPYTKWEEGLKKIKPKGIILSGGPASTIDSSSPQVSLEILNSDIPVLGICYGQQTLCSQLGGKVEHSCLLYTSPSPRDLSTSRMPSSA